MAQARPKKRKPADRSAGDAEAPRPRRTLSVQLRRGLREGALLVLTAAAVYLFIALASFDPGDPGWSRTGVRDGVNNLGGRVGAWFADLFLYLFGYLAYLAPVMVAYSGWLVFRGRRESGELDLHLLGVRWLGFSLTLVSGCGLAALHFLPGGLPLSAGGLVGEVTGKGLLPMFDLVGVTLFLLALFLTGFTWFTGLSWFVLMDRTGHWTLWLLQRTGDRLAQARARYRERRASRTRVAEEKDARREEKRRETERRRAEKRRKAEARQEAKAGKKGEETPSPSARLEPVLMEAPEEAHTGAPAAERDPGDAAIQEATLPVPEKPEPPARTSSGTPAQVEPGTPPPVTLLDDPKPQEGGFSEEDLESMSRLVEEKLRDFGVQVEVVEVHPGPVITRFELQPAPGLKVSRISGLSKDLARALSVISVRIVEVIPGKSTVGMEIPNQKRELVSLSEIFRAPVFDGAGSALTLALGKDIGGQAVVADLAKMPHLLVAGTTGSGKSVAINAMLLSLLFKSRPEEVRLILIDPKMLELSIYEGIPHLLAPVVTDMKEASNALRWGVAEMERRYKLMSHMGVRNIAGYNRKIREATARGEPIPDPFYNPQGALDPEAPPPLLEPLPFIVIVVDEFADMMMVVGKKVEELIARLAQKARAAGIHLILATQRPSVDVITGLIKANIPTRIAFQVSSRVDSRTILDQMGAEQLLGHGDMLYLPPGSGHPVRLHGAFVADHEVHAVVDFLKAQGEPHYLDEVLEEPEAGGATVPGLEPVEGGEESDPLYDQAVAIVLESRKASISYVQRRLKIGYNRAARMIEDMEHAGVVSPLQSNGNREVLAPAPARED
ncbi:DNA translocase FtsK [Ectothiorhodospira mobilis]|uniref:DNA translocase FtsK n=1 Tax=Ectothiorhodospira mobilis TaxID=195064 RepID=UPI001EE8F985|nr:DNA translocase FtsK [Ectothiorhodospira mobilis]MCG5535624.1 DNA translocase FtsK 4TM domain-containing protein [Ectothiorhodospira mobilis]